MRGTVSGEGIVAVKPDPDHDIDLKHGIFDQTHATDLHTAFGKLATTGSKRLCVFFHGGLVSQQAGLETASKLIQGYTDAGAYPFFFIWKSDLLTVIQELLHPHQHDAGYVDAANRGVAEVTSRVAAILDLEASLKSAAKVRLRAPPMDLGSLAQFAHRYDTAWAKRPGGQLPVTPQQLEHFAEWLLTKKLTADPRFRFTPARLKGDKNPLARIIERLNSGHGHGLYTTVIEELFIAMGLAKHLGSKIWGQMKDDIDASFGADPNAGGVAFLKELAEAWRQNPSLKVTLVGHSAGAIYVQRFLDAFDVHFASQPDRQVEVITLAAAVSFARMHEGLAVLKRRVSKVRLFGLSGKRESGYWEVPGIYNKSLLYIVCSLCEADPEADKPLVGMQRYWGGNRPYDLPFITEVSEFLQPAGTNRTVWARSPAGAKPGFQSNAKHHGSGPKNDGFPVEALTHQSVCYALKNGL